MLHSKDFEDIPYCPHCYHYFTDENIEDIAAHGGDPEFFECPSCNKQMSPEIRTADDQIEDYGDVKYHESIDDMEDSWEQSYPP